MARCNPNVIVNAIDAVLKERLFRPTKKTWRLVKPQTILVVDLWKSPWGPIYNIDFGILIRQLSSSLKPTANVCHISHRLSSLAAEYNESIGEKMASNVVKKSVPTKEFIAVAPAEEQMHLKMSLSESTMHHNVLDLGNTTISNTERVSEITADLIAHGIPFLAAWDDLEKIQKLLLSRDSNYVRFASIWADVYKLFRIPIP